MWRIRILTGCLLFQLGCWRHPTDEGVHQATGNEISVCEALQNFQRYNAKLVTIRGIYFFELRETCGSEVIIGNRAWPAVIQPLNSYRADVHADFTTDFGSLKALDELTWREAQAHKREEIWVKISGSLQVVDVNKYASEAVVRGFGHSGNFPAALFVKKILSVEIKPNPTYDYGDLLLEHIQ
jgi:hypothetical protein